MKKEKNYGWETQNIKNGGRWDYYGRAGSRAYEGVEEESQVPAKSQAGYDKKMFRIIVDSVDGDKVNVQFPVGAIKKILKVTGKLPIADKDLQGVDLEQMMEAISECLDEEIEGDFVNVNAADGTTVRVYVGI